MIYQLPDLPYKYDALEPYIDAETMKIHHDKHHATYVENLNEALSDHPQLQKRTLETLLSSVGTLPEGVRNVVRNNGGGHYNHSLFWKAMKQDGGGSPTGDLADAIKLAFGTYADFKSSLSQAALRQFGSGWAWLCLHDGKLCIEATPNQDNPLMKGAEPVLGLDVWEHAYYLRYKNKRADYVDAWWNVVNWEQVASNFAAARKAGRASGSPVNDPLQSARHSR